MSSTQRFARGAALAGSIALALAAACGPSSPDVRQPTAAPTPPATNASPAPYSPSTSAAGSGSAGEPTSPPPEAAEGDAHARLAALPPNDICHKNTPPPHEFFGLLSKARCDQEMFITMANISTELGVECKHCHAPHPTDSKKEDYVKRTPRKEIANWMNMHLMKALKPADGSKFRCKSCHVDPDTGKPVLKILGNPRDPVKAQEWMTMVLVNKFVTAKGEKLKCKSCHVDNFSKPGFQAKVLLRSQQLPPH
jgi:hypothetical protein